MKDYWVVMSAPANESGIAADENDKLIKLFLESDQSLLMTHNYHAQHQNGSVKMAVKSGISDDTKPFYFYCVLALKDYTNGQYYLANYLTSGQQSQVVHKGGSLENVKVIRSIENVLDSLYYVAQVKNLDDENGVNIYH